MNLRLKELGHTGSPVLCSVTVMGFFPVCRASEGCVRDEAAWKEACLLGVDILKRAYAGSEGVDALSCSGSGGLASYPVSKCGAVNKLIGMIEPINGKILSLACATCQLWDAPLLNARGLRLFRCALALSRFLSFNQPLFLACYL